MMVSFLQALVEPSLHLMEGNMPSLIEDYSDAKL
jgi:hypothetical protein